MCLFKGICYTGHMIPVMSNIKEISWSHQRQKGAVKSRLEKLNLVKNYEEVSNTFRKSKGLKKPEKKSKTASKKAKINKTKVRANKSFVNTAKVQRKTSESETLIFPAIFFGILLFTLIVFNQESDNLREIAPYDDSANTISEWIESTPMTDNNINLS